MYLNQPLPAELLTCPEWDRRESLRYPLEINARIWKPGSRHRIPARITNYSSSGLGVISQEALTLGQKTMIAAGHDLEDIVCVTAVPCWQVKTIDGMMIGFELEESEGKIFGGWGAGQRSSKPMDQGLMPPRLKSRHLERSHSAG